TPSVSMPASTSLMRYPTSLPSLIAQSRAAAGALVVGATVLGGATAVTRAAVAGAAVSGTSVADVATVLVVVVASRAARSPSSNASGPSLITLAYRKIVPNASKASVS